MQIPSCSTLINGASAISSCVFVDCNATDKSPDGGGICIWFDTKMIGIADCLLSFCHTNDDGGAIRYDFVGYIKKSFPLRFCFFNDNSVVRNANGNDVAISSFAPEADDPVFLHCFSNSEQNRIAYQTTDGWSMDDYDWLPLGTVIHMMKCPRLFQNHEG